MTKQTIAQRLGQNMRERRFKTGMSQDHFADTIEMHRAYYAALERGEKNLSLSTLHRLAKGFGVTMAELLAGVDS
jgi:transcriptional regulator with XRE-family HTH domain